MMRRTMGVWLLVGCLIPWSVFAMKAEKSLEEAKRLIAGKHYVQALAQLKEGSSQTFTDEQQFSVLLLQGKALLGLKELDKAGKKSEGALSLFQDNPNALILMGKVEKAKGHREVAEQLFWRVLKDNPKHPIARSEVTAMQMEDSMLDPTAESDTMW